MLLWWVFSKVIMKKHLGLPNNKRIEQMEDIDKYTIYCLFRKIVWISYPGSEMTSNRNTSRTSARSDKIFMVLTWGHPFLEHCSSSSYVESMHLWIEKHLNGLLSCFLRKTSLRELVRLQTVKAISRRQYGLQKVHNVRRKLARVTLRNV